MPVATYRAVSRTFSPLYIAPLALLALLTPSPTPLLPLPDRAPAAGRAKRHNVGEQQFASFLIGPFVSELPKVTLWIILFYFWNPCEDHNFTMSSNFSSEAQEQQIDNGAHVTDTNNYLHSRTELEMSEMFNTAVIGGEYATGITDGIDSGAVDLEAQLIALQSQTSDNERRRELLLKLAGWAFTASSAALFSVLSANLREMKGRIRVLFTACTASLVGAHLCSGVIIAMLLLLKRYFACLACALEVMCYVASGLMVISGFLAFALLQYLSIQKGVT